jgi:predicted aspartyl protease
LNGRGYPPAFAAPFVVSTTAGFPTTVEGNHQDVYRSRARVVRAAVLLLCWGVVATACHAGPIVPAQRSPQRDPHRSGSTETVPLDVRRDGAGGVIALVRVSIGGRGPFLFALDTGASSSLLDAAVATRLGLRPLPGNPERVHGIAGVIDARRIRVASWRVGSARLPSSVILTADVSFGPGLAPAGLLGSDVLSAFRTVTIDYRKGTLTLRGAA